MNTQQLIAITTLAFAGSAAFAQEATSDAWMQVAGTQTRSAVTADVAQARAEGSLQQGGEATVFSVRPLASNISRDEVRAEARAAVRDSTIDVYNVGA
jgi:hypothetical protein